MIYLHKLILDLLEELLIANKRYENCKLVVLESFFSFALHLRQDKGLREVSLEHVEVLEQSVDSIHILLDQVHDLLLYEVDGDELVEVLV